MSPLRYAVVGLEHPHVYSITMALTGGGAELAGYHSDNPEAAAGFDALFDRPPRFESIDAVLDDGTVDLVVPVGVPADRADAAIAAMEAGKDWGVRPTFLMPVSDQVVVMGFTGAEMESRSFSIVEQMYRRKIFFEDAGKMKFARNMTMPGSIEDEIKSMIRSALF